MKYIFLFSLLFLNISICLSQSWVNLPNNPEECGYVKWGRNYNHALEKSKSEKKPIFILFQEVPGCSTCKNYGNNILKHPHIVEAIESYFVPLVIYNNKGGHDAKILGKFNEPSWNNPVVRIIDPNTEDDLLPRLSNDYCIGGIVKTINKAIFLSGNLVPEYLNLLEKETQKGNIKTTHLAMYCFWSGEKNLAKLDGVNQTNAGFMNGKEVVKVIYNSDVISEVELIKYASEAKCGDQVFSKDQKEIDAAKKINISASSPGKFTIDKESKYYLHNHPLSKLPMTELQALKINSALAFNLPYEVYLSPRQIELAGMLKENSASSIGKPFVENWYQTLKI